MVSTNILTTFLDTSLDTSATQTIIGSEEWCSLPELVVPAIKAHINSSISISCLRVYNLQTLMTGGALHVRYDIHPLQHNLSTRIRCESLVTNRKQLDNTRCYVIQNTLQLGENTKKIDIALVTTDINDYRFNLNADAVEGYLIDLQRKCLLGKKKPQELKDVYGNSSEQKKCLKIGLLATNKLLYSHRRLIDAGQERGHDIQFYNIEECFFKLDSDEPEIRYRGELLNELDAIIPRIRPSLTFYGCALARQFESMGIFSLNSANAISRSRDKLESLQIMQKNGITIPRSAFSSSPRHNEQLIDAVDGAPLIIKLLSGTQGQGVILTDSHRSTESVIEAFQTSKTPILIQKFIEESNGCDLRIFIIDGKVIAAMKRIATEGEFRANVHKGASVHKAVLNEQERHLAVQAAKSFGLHVAGVDIIQSENGPMVLEVNSSPGLEGIEKTTDKDVAKAMIKAIERRLNG